MAGPSHRDDKIAIFIQGEPPCVLQVRFVEAYGLWRERRWAEWLAIVSGGIYLPIEIWELSQGITWPRLLLFSVNFAIVAYLGRALARHRQAHDEDANRTEP